MQTLINCPDFNKPVKWSKWTEDNYRKDAVEFYKQVLRFPRKDIDSDEFIVLVFETLEAFNMNTKGAKLSELSVFKKAIKKHTKTIQSLVGLKLEEVNKDDNTLSTAISSLFGLFDGHQLVQTASPLVTFSKTMHFFLPDLFMPIDRKYTLQFFYGKPPYKNKNYGRQDFMNTVEKQKKCFLKIFEEFRLFAQKHYPVLKEQVDKHSRWNRNIPKIIDNIIIAFVSENMED